MLISNTDKIDDMFSKITKEIINLAAKCEANGVIDPNLFLEHKVNRGLRDLDGKGVLTGLTEISEIISNKNIDGNSIPCEGELYYRGIRIEDLVNGFLSENRFGFEEATYLLMFGKLPDKSDLSELSAILSQYRTLPTTFVRDIIMKAPNFDMMNTLTRGVLTLHSYDEKANDTSISNVLRQCLLLIGVFPMIAVYSYQAYYHYFGGEDLFIRTPKPELSTAQNILHMLRKDGEYTNLEAHVLDLSLVLHAEHGGGNNSTFTTHVVTSSGTDTYGTIAAALSSLKGPKHGGANIKVVNMFDDLKKHVADWNDQDAIREYLVALLEKRAFDNAGLIYGMGHAVYSLSDPRANIFKQFVEKLSVEKGRTEEYNLYKNVEILAKEVIFEKRKIYKGVSANVDFYSGFVYSMLDIPTELFTPLFAIARISGWSAHRIEELINVGKIIRPAYKAVQPHNIYVPLQER